MQIKIVYTLEVNPGGGWAMREPTTHVVSGLSTWEAAEQIVRALAENPAFRGAQIIDEEGYECPSSEPMPVQPATS